MSTPLLHMAAVSAQILPGTGRRVEAEHVEVSGSRSGPWHGVLPVGWGGDADTRRRSEALKVNARVDDFLAAQAVLFRKEVERIVLVAEISDFVSSI